jgi:large subunit GTPase 1
LGTKPSQVENSKLDSVVERTDLEEFLDTALMSQKNFAANRGEAVVVGNIGDPLVITAEELGDTGLSELYEYENVPIPRRPYWDSATTPEELQRNERDAFLEWRRFIANMEEHSKLVMTPFEKNLDVWRQL